MSSIHPRARSWVWRSTEESRVDGQISLLAVFETLLCVLGYWVLILWFGVTWHHWMILVATPLVLLRSEQSVVLGAKWFDRYLSSDDVVGRSMSAVFLGSVILSGMVTWQLTLTSPMENHFLAGLMTGWLGVAVAAMIAVSGDRGIVAVSGGLSATLAVVVLAGAGSGKIAGTVVGASLESLMFVIVIYTSSPPMGSAIGIGVGLRAIATRFAATTRFLLPGLGHLSSNWRFVTLVSDMFTPPDLVPGSNRLAYGDLISLSWRRRDGTKKIFIDYLAMVWMSLIFFGPALLWRWSVKSTAWFYLPWLWARRGWKDLQAEELLIWAR